jgi:hypothetical protein
VELKWREAALPTSADRQSRASIQGHVVDMPLPAVTKAGSDLVLAAVHLHRHHFNIVVRELIAKHQPFSQGIQETPMMRLDSAIHANDEMLVRQTSGHSGVHESYPHATPRSSGYRLLLGGHPFTLGILSQFID